MKKKSFLAADPVYREQMESYTLKDTALALVYYALFMAAYYWMGREMTRTGNYWGEPVSAVAMLIPVLLCVKKLSGLGITLRNLKPSLLWGAAIGTVYLKGRFEFKVRSFLAFLSLENEAVTTEQEVVSNHFVFLDVLVYFHLRLE